MALFALEKKDCCSKNIQKNVLSLSGERQKFVRVGDIKISGGYFAYICVNL